MFWRLKILWEDKISKNLFKIFKMIFKKYLIFSKYLKKKFNLFKEVYNKRFKLIVQKKHISFVKNKFLDKKLLYLNK